MSIEIFEETNELGDVIGISVCKDDGIELRSFADWNGFIKWLFRFRCVGLDEPCHKPATEINEIVPRSASPDAMYWKNRVTLCQEHHREYHDKGVSDEAIRNLQERRYEYLEAIGRSEYI